LRVALADLKAVEALAAEPNPQYEINMGTWLRQNQDGPCEVCFAGAVMANRMKLEDKSDGSAFGYSPSHAAQQGHINAATREKLRGLNSARTGDQRTFVQRWTGKSVPAGVSLPYVDVPEYDIDPKAFKRAMNNMARRLERVGL
jgi:hypothetical protein